MKKTIMAMTVGTLVALLVLTDYFLAPLFHQGGNFVWVAFASWTVFFDSSLKERIAVVPSYTVGFLSANLIAYLAGCFGITNVAIDMAVSFMVNALIMHLVDVKFLTIAGIFVGIFTTFSRAGVGMEMWSLSLFVLIIAYGVLGLLCGHGCKIVSNHIEAQNPEDG